jgi:hypothetical protein
MCVGKLDPSLAYWLEKEYTYYLLSPYRLYDDDMKCIVMRAKSMSKSPYGLVTKAQLIKAFKQYCAEYHLNIKIETFLRKLRYCASKHKYIAYTNRRGVYKVLI